MGNATAGGTITAAVSACFIVKDASSRIETAIGSLRPHVAEICVYDTGSTDGTLELLAELATRPGAPIVVERGEWRDDFAWARERSFELASQAWRLYLDDDDVLVGGERLAAVVASAEQAGDRGISVAYDHHDAADGSPVWLWTNRILHQGSGRWEGVVHEFWRGLELDEIALAHPGALRVRHQRRAERKGHYRRLVEQAAADPVRTPRGLMWLGFELLGADDRGATTALHAYLEGGHDAVEGNPNGFRWVVLDQLAQAHDRLGDEAASARAAAARDAYTHQLSRAVDTGRIEDVEFWRRLLARMEELIAAEPAEPLLPGPATARRSNDAAISGTKGSRGRLS